MQSPVAHLLAVMEKSACALECHFMPFRIILFLVSLEPVVKLFHGVFFFLKCFGFFLTFARILACTHLLRNVCTTLLDCAFIVMNMARVVMSTEHAAGTLTVYRGVASALYSCLFEHLNVLPYFKIACLV